MKVSCSIFAIFRRFSYMRIATLCMCAVFLGGCDPGDLTPAQTTAICHALIGPIHFNTYNKKSGRYSGHVLALDLHQRNLVGQYLRCPAYR
jgi:hypothetical protein